MIVCPTIQLNYIKVDLYLAQLQYTQCLNTQSMLPQDKETLEKYDIDLLRLNHIKKIAEMKLSKDQYQQQLEKSYTLFKDLRIKQKFLNQLKIIIQLKSISEQELKVRKFDVHQFKKLLVKKSQLIYDIYIKKERNQKKNELFLRNEVSLQYFERNLNLQAFDKPYLYSLQALLLAKDQIVSEGIATKCADIQREIEDKQQQRQSILKKYQKLLQNIQQKRIQIGQQNLSIQNLSTKLNNQQILISNLHLLFQKQKSQQQSLIQQLKEIQGILAQKDSQQLTKERSRLLALKENTAHLKQVYSNLRQQYRNRLFNMDKILKQRLIVPQIDSNIEFTELEAELSDLKQKYDLIQKKKGRSP